MNQRQAKTIVVLGSFAPSLIKFRGHLIARMVARGHRVIAAAPDLEPDIVEQLEELGAQAVEMSMNRTGTNPLSDLDLLRRLTSFLRDVKPDVLIPYTAKPVIWGCLAARRAGVRQIAPMITGLGFAFAQTDGLQRRLMQQAIMWIYRRAIAGATQIFFQNTDDIETFQAWRLLPSDLPITMINGSGVDIELYSPSSLPEQPNFLMIARLIKAKGVREYAQAAMAVRRLQPEAQFRLVGWIDEGPDAITQADLNEWVATGIDYRGALEDVRPEISDASVYVLPSYREGTPRSVLEAMAMGRAIITTDAPGCRETVRHGENGFLIPVRDVDELTNAMLKLVEEPGLRTSMGAASRQIAEEKYDVHEVNKVILDELGL